MAPICGCGPFVDPFSPPGGIFKDPVLMCLNSWWPGILFDAPALLSIVRCMNVAIAGLRWGFECLECRVRVWGDEGGDSRGDIDAYRGEIQIKFERLIKPRASGL